MHFVTLKDPAGFAVSVAADHVAAIIQGNSGYTTLHLVGGHTLTVVGEAADLLPQINARLTSK